MHTHSLTRALTHVHTHWQRCHVGDGPRKPRPEFCWSADSGGGHGSCKGPRARLCPGRQAGVFLLDSSKVPELRVCPGTEKALGLCLVSESHTRRQMATVCLEP